MSPRLVVLLLLASTAIARAEPVRDDIVELRRGRLPVPLRVLGWTADNRLVLHVAYCGERDGGGDYCSVDLSIVGDDRTDGIALLAPVQQCDPDGMGCTWTVPTQLAAAAIKREREALAALGPLQPARPAGARELRVEQGPCWVTVLAGERLLATPVHFDEKACVYAGGEESIRSASVKRAVVSPDGTHVGAVVAITTKWMEWTDDGEVFVVYAR